MTSDDPHNLDVNSGHQVYTPKLLRWYDMIVHGMSNRWLWGCPTPLLAAWFEEHATDNHLDIGVGTGYFLDRCSVFSADARIGLWDANADCLAAAAKRLQRFEPEVFPGNLADPPAWDGRPFASASLMYVLHCLPGDAAFRRRALEHAVTPLTAEGKLFGATILGQPAPRYWLGRKVMASYNQKGIFGNERDTLGSLQDALESCLVDVELERVGSVALFAGRKRA